MNVFVLAGLLCLTPILLHIMWRGLPHFLAHPAVTDWLIRRAQRTPYTHITSPDGSEMYMERYWLFNPYPGDSSSKKRGLLEHLPSIHLHRIMRADHDRHKHDHPWRARTFILRGWYMETRLYQPGWALCSFDVVHIRLAGTTAALEFNEYHQIDQVSPGGVWTLFVTWKYQGTWGFLVDGVKVPWRTYLGLDGGA